MNKQLAKLLNQAESAGLVNRGLRRATISAKFKRNVSDPGDCADDPRLLMGLAIAEAELVPNRDRAYPGWIPQVQALGCAIANLPEGE